jgi:hypothetical protein
MRLALIWAALGFKLVGGIVIATHFDAGDAWLFCGLTLVLMGMFAANAALNCSMARTLDDEFDAGYRVGYRAGRRAPLVSQPVTSLDAFRNRRGEDGRVQATTVRAVAGDRPHARRPTTHAH